MLVTNTKLGEENMTLTAITYLCTDSLITKMVLLVYSGSGENGQIPARRLP